MANNLFGDEHLVFASAPDEDARHQPLLDTLSASERETCSGCQRVAFRLADGGDHRLLPEVVFLLTASPGHRLSRRNALFVVGDLNSIVASRKVPDRVTVG